MSDQPHRRFNPLNGEWLLVSPHRAKRPWQGQQDEPDTLVQPSHDSGCYLCPGNHRAGGIANPDYNDVFVFDNDFAALLAEPAEDVKSKGLFFEAAPATGTCRVICFSPDHNKTLPEMSAARDPRGRRYMGLTGSRTLRHPRLCPDFRKQGRDDGLLQPAPARADLGDKLCAC